MVVLRKILLTRFVHTLVIAGFIGISSNAQAKKPKDDPPPEPPPPPSVSFGVTERVSVSSDTTQGDRDSFNYEMSDDGNIIVFVSRATNLVPNDTNGKEDIFVHDRTTGITERVSVASDGTQADNWSSAASISSDGRYVAFASYANNLVADLTTYYSDVFVHDRITGVTELISVALDGTPANAVSTSPSISGDGRYVTFVSHATDLVENDINTAQDVFVRDRLNNTTELVSIATDGTQGDGSSRFARISGDGDVIAFLSNATTLVDNDTNGQGDIFVRYRSSRQTIRVSVSSTGVQSNGSNGGTAISRNGNVVGFSSTASNLVNDDTNGYNDVFVHDLTTGITERVNLTSNGDQITYDDSYAPALSADGRYVAFSSYSSQLITGANWWWYSDIFLRDRQTGVTEYISVAEDSTQGNDESNQPSISADGRFVAFHSYANNLVSGDTNGYVSDVFVRDRNP